MAQGAIALAPTVGTGLPVMAAEQREILEYEKIIQFRDAVLTGTHPRIKIPPHLVVGKQVNATRNVSSPNVSTPRTIAPIQPSLSKSVTYYENSSPFYNGRSPNNQRAATSSHIPMTTKSEINPILLEKSDDLIKAEIQLQRQRLERALREQIEQQRLAAKALLQTSESLPNFDLSEVLTKALAIVHPSTTAEGEPSVGARSSASDSFDENTFYSSQHDTPEPSSSQGQQEPLEVQSGGVVSADEHPVEIYSTNSQVGGRDVVMTGAVLSKDDNHLLGQAHSQTQLSSSERRRQNAEIHYGQPREAESSDSSISLRDMAGGASFKVSAQGKGKSRVSKHQNNPPPLNKTGSCLDYGEDDIDGVVQATTDELVRQAFGDNESPVIRAHNLSLFAPQPARVSPLATARNPPILQEALAVDGAPPAQVAALRKPSGISSTDSSPKGVKGAEKKKGKKKKHKASNKENPDTPDSPYIKPEPRSPSPFAVAPLPRPQKRQRQAGQYAAELNYDEPRYEPTEEVRERVMERVSDRYKEPQTYERFEERYEPVARRPEPTYQRLERDDVEYRRVSDGHYARRPQSPAVYALPYAPSEVRPVRAVSHAIVDRRPREEPVYYREPLPRASIRPDADRERSKSPVLLERRSPIPMGPPRQPIRIVVDSYGREYIDPTPAPSMRQSLAPPARYKDAEVIYERAPIRTGSGRAPVEYEEDGIIYRRPSPPIAVPRRVVTQPEYIPAEYRSYRQREYSVRPMAPPGEEYIQLRGAPGPPVAPERRQASHFEEAPREYVSRAATVRPDPARYEAPRDYVARLQSVRPELGTREVVPQSQREFSVQPVDTIPRREQGIGREGERYYDEVATRRPTAEVAFIERPRAREQSVLVYADDVRRQVRDVYR